MEVSIEKHNLALLKLRSWYFCMVRKRHWSETLTLILTKGKKHIVLTFASIVSLIDMLMESTSLNSTHVYTFKVVYLGSVLYNLKNSFAKDFSPHSNHIISVNVWVLHLSNVFDCICWGMQIITHFILGCFFRQIPPSSWAIHLIAEWQKHMKRWVRKRSFWVTCVADKILYKTLLLGNDPGIKFWAMLVLRITFEWLLRSVFFSFSVLKQWKVK